MANTINTGTYSSVWRAKYATKMLNMALRSALVANAVCKVDESNSFYIYNPYISSTQTAPVATIAGSYAVTDWATTEDSLTVTDQVTYGVHVREFENVLSSVDVYTSFVEELQRAVAAAADKWAVNVLCEDGTGTYTTPAGGFTSTANWTVILANLLSKVAGYRDAQDGYFLILENTDLVGVIASQMASGFNFADAALRNGLVSNQAGVDIYVVRSGTFTDDTTSTVSGTKTWTNSGHRVFGVKGVATFAMPGGIHYEEKSVTLKTGKEIAVWANIGLKVWATTATLVVDITLA